MSTLPLLTLLLVVVTPASAAGGTNSSRSPLRSLPNGSVATAPRDAESGSAGSSEKVALATQTAESADVYVTAGGSSTPRKLQDRFSDSINPMDDGAACGSQRDDSLALAAAAARARSKPAGIVVTCRLRIAGTVGAVDAPIRFEGGGALDLQPGGSVTLRGSVDAGLQQIVFSNGGAVAFGQGCVRAFRPEWWGARADGQTPSRAGIQSAIIAASAGRGEVELAEGTYVVDGELNLTSIARVANGEPFGLSIRGRGMGTVIKTTAAGGVLFNLDAGTQDLQLHAQNLQVFSTTGDVVAFLLGKLSRYSLFDAVRIGGFKEGLRFRRPIYGITFRDLYVRGSRGAAIVVDAEALGTDVITEVRFFGGYIDNNGSGVADGGPYVPAIHLYNAQGWKFFGTTIEGNYGGGLQFDGRSENIAFYACRFEETLVRYGTGGHIHRLADTAKNVTFFGCELAYDGDGVRGTKGYQLLLAPRGSGPVRFVDCQIVDTSNRNASDVFGESPGDAAIEVEGLLNGIGPNYHVKVPSRYLGRAVGEARHTTGSAPPQGGAWKAGDIVWNSAPSAGGPPGWICIAAGSPGTWKAMASISR